MKARDPADAAQKRMGRLFAASGMPRGQIGSFHSLRHGKISLDREAALPEHMIRHQVGHEAGDVHGRQR